MPRSKTAAKSLVIVESPAKARTIAGYLGSDYVVESSIGHIRDLPRSARDVPAAHKKQAWARLGVDVEHGFRPLYVVDPAKRPVIAKLKALLMQAEELLLATDEDREGESIAWHLLEVLKPKVPVKRMVFHEITQRAIEQAVKHPRQVDRSLVDAQEARRILDRLYGYEVSPVLWKKVMPKLSAGRVQSVATRILVERERERMRFREASYWDVEGMFATTEPSPDGFSATLVAADGRPIATGKDFGEDGTLSRRDVVVMDEAQAQEWVRLLSGGSFTVRSVERKPHRRSPSPPFMTSTLQQEAGRKLKFSAARTMRAAQALYESGYITYMRTDSTTLSAAAVRSARDQIERLYGGEHLPERARAYRKRVKNAQEAHEAIRPAGDVFRMPEAVARQVGRDEARLYELIWKRTLASQMRDALGETVALRVQASVAGGHSAEFAAGGYTITFPGFLRAYVEGSDDPSAELENRERPLPPLREGQSLSGRRFVAQAHKTQPPARFTEASLVRRLEELGVGRPSTYASIISTILDRGYVWRKGSALVPSFKAFAVVALLEQHFTALVDYAFTARMEDELDAIARGGEQLEPWLRRFYFGAKPGAQDAGREVNGTQISMGLKSLVADQLSEIDARAINSLPIGTDDQGRQLTLRVGRYGAYVQCGDETASVPDELPPDELTVDRALELLSTPNGVRELGIDPDSGLPVLVRAGRFGAYVQLGEGGGKEKPKTCSLLRSMSADSVTLEQALKLLLLPRQVGVDSNDGESVTAQLGRYGPYLTKGSQSRTLANEEAVFTISLPEALALFAQPRQGRGRRSSGPLAELGVDPESGRMLTLREGPFGPYVSDGEVNAALRKGDTPDGISLERARELLRLRNERGPVARKRGKSTKARAGASRRKAAGETGSQRTAESAQAQRRQPAKGTNAKPSRVSRVGAKAKTKKQAAAKAASAKRNSARKSQRAGPSGDGSDSSPVRTSTKQKGSAATGASRAERTGPTGAPSALDG